MTWILRVQTKEAAHVDKLMWTNSEESVIVREELIGIDIDGVRTRLWLALQQFYVQDKYLLEHSIGEWGIVHRISVYLERTFPIWHLDYEFNQGGDLLMLPDADRAEGN